MKAFLFAVAAAAVAAASPPASAAGAQAKAPLATVNGVAVPTSREEIMVRERVARGAQDTPQLRAAIRDDLINREIVAQEAARTGIAKRPDVRAEIDLARQNVIVAHYVREWVRKHPVTDADVKKEYERAKARTGGKEYRARHILVETEDEAKSIIAQLDKGASFEKLAEQHSKDAGSKAQGGDLDWNVPSAFDKNFADAMVKLQKGKYTETPVKTRFGYHVIELEDVRPIKFPALEEVKPRLEEQLMQARVRQMVTDLRAKAKVD